LKDWAQTSLKDRVMRRLCAITLRPTVQPNPKDLAEFVKFQEIEDFLKSREINTLVLISQENRISGFSLENPEGIEEDKSIF